MSRLVGYDGVHNHGMLQLGSGRNAYGRGIDTDIFVVLGHVTIVVDAPRDGHFLATVLIGDVPQQVHNGIVLIVHTRTEFIALAGANAHIAVTTVAIENHRAVHTPVAVDTGQVVATTDVLLRLIVEEGFLASALRLDVNGAVHYPAVIVLLVVERHLQSQLVSTLQCHVVTVGVFKLTSRSPTRPARQQQQRCHHNEQPFPFKQILFHSIRFIFLRINAQKTSFLSMVLDLFCCKYTTSFSFMEKKAPVLSASRRFEEKIRLYTPHR